MIQTTQRGTLLLVSIGPIQAFIASARRCQDLWFGSWLLSDLARVVGEAVQAVGGTTVVFPTGLEDPDRPGVSNLILARLSPHLQPAEVADRARDALRGRLRDIRTAAWRGCGEEPVFRREVAERQVDELLEFAWVSVEDTGRWSQDRVALYGRMACAKNTRTWGPPGWTTLAGRGVPKSSLDGERESVIDEAWRRDASPTERRRRFGLKGGERLCGVGLLKRLGEDLDADTFRGRRPPFHSTAHLAMGPVLRRLHDLEATDASARYLDVLREVGLDTQRFRVADRDGGPHDLNGHDGVLLLESRLDDHFEEVRAAVPPQARTALRELLREAGVRGAPSPYYAYLVADGDSLGRWLSSLPELEDLRVVAAALNDFAVSCRELVAEHEGSLVFAGGDDVLALLPLHTAVACARALAERFADRVGRAVASRWPAHLPPMKPPTLSVGLGITHCLESMTEARAVAHRAERLAKGLEGKNALAIVFAPRSGGELAVAGGWDEPFPLDRRLHHWMNLVDGGGLSASTGHDLVELATHFEGRDAAEELATLVRGTLARKRGVGGGPPTEELVRHVAQGGMTSAARVASFAAELLVARHLARARRTADGRSDGEPT